MHCNRRKFLISTALASSVVFPGCLGTDESENHTPPPGNQDTPNQQEPTSQAPTQQDTRTQTPNNVAEASVTDSSLQVSEGEHRTTAAVTGTIENTGNVPLLICNAVAKFYNADGELLNTSGWQVMALQPGEVWVPWLRYTGDASKVDRGTLEVESTTDTRAQHLHGGGSAFGISESNVQVPVDAGAMPRFDAKITNETSSEITRVRLIAKVYDEGERVLAHGTSVVNNFGASEVWNAEAALNVGGDRGDQIARHNVVLYSRF